MAVVRRGGGALPAAPGERPVVTVHVLASQLRFALTGQRSYLERRQRIDAGDDRQLRFRLQGTVAAQGAVVVANMGRCGAG